MSCELIGAKLMAPYFGTSLYVWASVLALTLGGLTLGYFWGGRLSKKYSGDFNLLYLVLIIASLLLIIMPWTSIMIMDNLVNLSLELGTIISLLLYLVPPLCFMGMVSPIIINLLTEESSDAGKNAGKVYAISTLGGILFTFLMGFYFIPIWGLKIPALLNGILLISIPTLLILKSKKSPIVLTAVVLFSFLNLNSGERFNSDEYSIIYSSEGILGQIKVVDHPAYEFTEDNKMGRALIVNNTLQTFVGHDNDFQYSIWNWSQYFPTIASIYPENSEVLLLGLGGGTLVKQLNRLGHSVDVVEIDKRVKDVSVEYFSLDPKTNVVIDDARHYIRTCKKKYDIVIYDTFLSESVPEHLLTIEGFEDVRKILKPKGMILSNFYGAIEGSLGIAARSVYKTLSRSDFNVEILATPGDDRSRNLIFIASDDIKDYSIAEYSDPNSEKIEDLEQHFIDYRFMDTSSVEILYDHKPILAKLYNPLAKSWKRSYNDYYAKYFKD